MKNQFIFLVFSLIFFLTACSTRSNDPEMDKPIISNIIIDSLSLAKTPVIDSTSKTNQTLQKDNNINVSSSNDLVEDQKETNEKQLAQEEEIDNNTKADSKTAKQNPVTPPSPSTIIANEPEKKVTVNNNYTVVKLVGDATLVGTNSTLKTRSLIPEKASIKFNSPKTQIAVIDKNGNAYLLQASSDALGYKRTPLNGSFKTRATLSNYSALVSYFSRADFLILGEELSIEVGQQEFPLTENTFFFIEYEYKGEKIPKQLAHRGQSFIIKKQDLYKVDGKIINPTNAKNLILYYYNKAKEEELKISAVHFIFPNEQQLKNEVQILLSNSQLLDKKAKIKKIEHYIHEFYGEPDKGNFKSWVKNNFGL